MQVISNYKKRALAAFESQRFGRNDIFFPLPAAMDDTAKWMKEQVDACIKIR